MDEIVLIKKYQILQFLRQISVALVAPTFVVYLMGKGLSIGDVSLVALSFFVVLLVVEVPTGIFADRYGRKKSMLVSAAIAIIGPLIYVWAQGLWPCILAEAVYAVSSGFCNGALDSWIKHELQILGKDITHLAVANARGSQAAQIAFALGALVGGFLASANMDYPWIAGAAFDLVLVAAVARLMRENYRPPETRPALLDGARIVAVSWPLKFACLVGFLQYLAITPANLYWQPFYAAAAPDPMILGVMCFAFCVVNFAGAKISEKKLVARGLGSLGREAVASQFLTGVFLAAAAIFPWFFVSLLFYLAHEGTRGIFQVARQTYLQRAITVESQRATVASIASLFDQAGSIVAYLAMAFWAGKLAIDASWIISGSLCLVAPMVWYWQNKTIRRQT